MTGHDACAAGRCPALVLCFAGWLSLPRLGVLAFAVPFALCAMLRCGRGVGGDVRHLPSNYGFSVVKGSLGGTCADDDPSDTRAEGGLPIAFSRLTLFRPYLFTAAVWTLMRKKQWTHGKPCELETICFNDVQKLSPLLFVILPPSVQGWAQKVMAHREHPVSQESMERNASRQQGDDEHSEIFYANISHISRMTNHQVLNDTQDTSSFKPLRGSLPSGDHLLEHATYAF
ncbi:hypothetical protein HDK90DRAFT_464003 [Phyllosticta capitalensis]|uniref:Uncharacterized protein n=1 Tax=Phyllosticta capitalensis TaxID=121624 RepID=A0ABR1YW85_9PEZI